MREREREREKKALLSTKEQKEVVITEHSVAFYR